MKPKVPVQHTKECQDAEVQTPRCLQGILEVHKAVPSHLEMMRTFFHSYTERERKPRAVWTKLESPKLYVFNKLLTEEPGHVECQGAAIFLSVH